MRPDQEESTKLGALALRAAAAGPGDAVPSPEAAALHDEERRSLLEAIGRLPERDRLVLGYRYYFDLTEAEMAAALDCRPGTVKSRLSRAMAHLRSELGEDG